MYAKVQSYAILNQHILILALWRQSCKLKAKAIGHLPSLLAVIDAVYLTFSESGYGEGRCQYLLNGNDYFSLDIYPEGAIYHALASLRIISTLFWRTMCLGLPDQHHHDFENHPGLDIP